MSETQRILEEFYTVLHNRMERCRTFKSKGNCVRKTAKEYEAKIEIWHRSRVDFPHHAHTNKFLTKFAKDRRNDGYSIRQIMKMMSYKSPRSVQCLLTPHKMKGRG